jgi:hypothetical protein
MTPYPMFLIYVSRIEEIPPDELNLAEDELLVPVAHFSKDVYATFGTPFVVKVKHVSTHFISSKYFSTIRLKLALN